MRRPPLLRGLLFPALVAALAAVPAGADPWYQHYDLAEKALAAEDWTAAVEQLNEAIARKGDSGARVRTYGMKFGPAKLIFRALVPAGSTETELRRTSVP